jgi:dTDP-glucose pyrophosphorylase
MSKNIIHSNFTLFQALERLQKIKNKTLIIINKNLKFISTLTDGDIRRALLKKIKITDSVQKIVNRKSITTNETNYNDYVNEKFLKYKIALLPIVNNNGKYLGFHEFNKNKINKSEFIIIAGGFGKRLNPITKKIPKALVKIKNRALLDYIILKAKKEGFSNIKIITYHKSGLIKKFIKLKAYNNIKIYRENRPMGTIGGIRNINLDSNKNLNFLITNCDILTNVSYKSILDFHITSNADLTVATQIKIIKSEFGNVYMDKKNIIKFEEKPERIENIVIGIYVLKDSIIKLLKSFKKNEKIDMPDFINLLIKKKRKLFHFH